MDWKWLGSVGKVIKGYIIPSSVYLADTQAQNTALAIASNTALEQSRQEWQLTQLKLVALQQKDNQAFQAELSQLNHEHLKEIEEFRQSVNWAISQNNLDFQKWRFEKEKVIAQLGVVDREGKTGRLDR